MNVKRRWQSRLAAFWSAMALFPDLDSSQLFPGPDELPHEFQETAFLWTWTFADEAARTDCSEAMRRWRTHARWLKDSGKKLLRALERGSKGGAYHFHAITHQRWDINELREMANLHGFGRINVKVIPRSKIGYVAKYLGKPGRFPIPKGTKLWACIGYEGVHMCDIRCRKIELTVPVLDRYPRIISVKRWNLDGVTIAEKILRPDWNGDETEIQNMTITKENITHIASLVAGGAIMCVGEYRTCTARKLVFDEQKKGVPTGRKVERKMVEHGIERGNEQLTVTEWLPDDADITTYKTTLQKGEPVLVEVSQFSRQFGITCSSIRSLASFNGKLS
jgi:hypothetical protein